MVRRDEALRPDPARAQGWCAAAATTTSCRSEFRKRLAVRRRQVIAPLLAAEPELAADFVSGIRASGLLADQFGEHLQQRRAAGRSSLMAPL
jgi:hypothetical protein